MARLGSILNANFRLGVIDPSEVHDPRMGAVCLPRAGEATVTVSAETALTGVKENAYKEGLTYDFWRPGSSGTHWLKAAFANAYDSLSVDVSPEGMTNPSGIDFSPDGKRAYICGGSQKKVYQYSLLHPFDLSVVSFVQSISLSEDNIPRDLRIKSDGLMLWTVDQTGDILRQYNLTIAWDISTLVYSGISLDITSEGTTPHGFSFGDSGLKLYVVNAGDDEINEYTLTTAYDVSTASATSLFDISGFNTAPLSLWINSQGTRIYITDASGGGTLFKITLSTAWDLTTASYDGSGETLDLDAIAGFGVNPTGIYITPDESRLLLIDPTNLKSYQFTIGIKSDYLAIAAHDLSDAGATVKMQHGVYTAFTLPAVTGSGLTMVVGNSGLALYILDNVDRKIYQFTMSIAYDIRTASATSSYAISESGALRGLALSADGTGLWITEETNETAFQYTLSSAWDITSATYDGAGDDLDITADDSAPRGINWNDDGSKFYVVGIAGNKVFQYELSSAYDMSSATAPSVKSMDVSGEGTSPSQMRFNADGTKAFVLDLTTQKISEYTLSSAYDASTGTYASKFFDVSLWFDTATGFDFNSDGTVLFVTGTTLRKVVAFSLETAYDLSTMVGYEWHDSTDAFTAPDSSPLMISYTAQTALNHRLVLVATSAPQIGVIHFGMSLKMNAPISTGFDPPQLNQRNRYVNEVSEGGAFLGKSLIAEGSELSLQIRGVTLEWIRDQWEATVRLIEQHGFFFSARDFDTLTDEDAEVFYGWTTEQPRGNYNTSVVGAIEIKANGIVT